MTVSSTVQNKTRFIMLTSNVAVKVDDGVMCFRAALLSAQLGDESVSATESMSVYLL